MFHNCEGQSHKTWSERRAEADSNRCPSAYQPNALPLGQTGSRTRHNSSVSSVDDDWPMQFVHLDIEISSQAEQTHAHLLQVGQGLAVTQAFVVCWSRPRLIRVDPTLSHLESRHATLGPAKTVTRESSSGLGQSCCECDRSIVQSVSNHWGPVLSFQCGLRHPTLWLTRT